MLVLSSSQSSAANTTQTLKCTITFEPFIQIRESKWVQRLQSRFFSNFSMSASISVKYSCGISVWSEDELLSCLMNLYNLTGRTRSDTPGSKHVFIFVFLRHRTFSALGVRMARSLQLSIAKTRKGCKKSRRNHLF